MLHSGLLLLASCGKEPLTEKSGQVSAEDNTISNAQLKVEIFDSDSCVNNAIKYVKDIYDNQKQSMISESYDFCLMIQARLVLQCFNNQS